MTQQMEAFRRDMAKDGSAQRGEVRRLVQGFSQRAEALVESTLRVCPMHFWFVCGMWAGALNIHYLRQSKGARAVYPAGAFDAVLFRVSVDAPRCPGSVKGVERLMQGSPRQAEALSLRVHALLLACRGLHGAGQLGQC